MTEWGDDEHDLGEGPDQDEVIPETLNPAAIGKLDEKLLLCYLVANPLLWSKARTILKPEYFSSPLDKAVRFVLEYDQKFHALPNRMIINAQTKVNLDPVEDASDKAVVEFISERVESHCRTKATLDFLLRASEKIDKNATFEDVAPLVVEMRDIAQISMAPDLGSEIHEDVYRMLQDAEKNDGIPIGVEFVDEVLGGGVTRPSFNLYSAPAGDGKSMWLANMAVNHIRVHKTDALYVSLELSEPLIHKRLAAIMTDTEINQVYRNLEQIQSRLKRDAGNEGRLFVKRFPIRGTTIEHIKTHIANLKHHKGANIQLLVIDYMDLMSPIQSVDIEKIHIKDKEVAQEIYDYAHEEQQIVWSASQQTKGSDEESSASKGKVAGGTEKVNACDNLLIGKRLDEDAVENRIWVHVKKARSSGAIHTKIPIFWHPGTQKMTSGDRGLFIEANPRFFGKPADRVEGDPVAREVGHTKQVNKLTSPPPAVGPARRADDIRKELARRYENAR